MTWQWHYLWLLLPITLILLIFFVTRYDKRKKRRAEIHAAQKPPIVWRPGIKR